MRVLAFDPGAKRAGWSVLSRGPEEGEIRYEGSGIYGLTQSGKYQEHRIRLIEFWVLTALHLFETYAPDRFVSETVPPLGGNSASITHRQLALTVVTTVQAIAQTQNIPLEQMGASSVKRRVAGVGKASKVTVRDGMLRLLPELEPRRPEWTGKNAVWDEVDALAVGLSYFIGAA